MFRSSAMSERASRLSNQLLEDYDVKFAGLEQPYGGSFLRKNELGGGGGSLASLYTGTSIRATRQSLAPMGSTSMDCEETLERSPFSGPQNLAQPSQSQVFQQQQLVSQSQMNGEAWRQNRNSMVDVRSRARRSYFAQRHGGGSLEYTATASTLNSYEP